MSTRSKATVKQAVDMLWAHQIRRENALLHKQLQDLQSNLKIISNEVNGIREATTNAETSIRRIVSRVERNVSEQAILCSTISEMRSAGQSALERIVNLESAIGEHKADQVKSLAQISSDLNRLNVEVKKLDHACSINHVVTESLSSLRHNLKLKAERSDIEVLGKKVEQLEGFQLQLINDRNISTVDDCSELNAKTRPTEVNLNKEQMSGLKSTNPVSTLEQASQLQQNVPPNVVVPHTQTPVDHSLVLTFHRRPRESTTPDDIDLDENVDSASYARGLYMNDTAPAALVMTPQDGTIEPPVHGEAEKLQQERLHSWDRYHAEGQALLRRLSHECENRLVRRFVEGLYSQNQKKRCIQWLDARNWTWENITLFGSSAFSVLHEGFGSTSNNSNNVSQNSQCRRADGQLTELADLDKVRKEEMSVGNERPVIEPRRSQRLVERASIVRNLDPSNALKSQPVAQVQSQRIKKSKTSANPSNSKIQISKPEHRPDVDLPRGRQSHRSQNNKSRPSRRQEKARPAGHKEVTTAESSRGAQVYPADHEHLETGKLHRPALHDHHSSTSPILAQDSKQPIPRLVERKRKLGQMSETLSDADADADGDDWGKLPRMPALTKSDRSQERRKRRRRKLPLPPPPEIPILSTSDM